MKKTKSLQYHQSLQFGLVAALPVIIIMILVWLFLLPAMRSETRIRHQGMARSIAGQVSSHVLGGQRQLAALAKFIEGRSGLSSQQLAELMDSQCGDGELFETIYIVSSQKQIVQVVGLAQSRRAIRRDLLGLDLSGRTFAMEAGHPEKQVWSETFMSTVSRRQAVALTIPLGHNLITAEITLDNLSSVISQLPVEAGFLIYVIDRKGRIVADSQRLHWGQRLNDSLFSLAGTENSGSFISGSFELDGKEYLGTVVTIDELGWKVLAAQPLAKAYESLRTIISMFILAVVIALLLALLLSWNRAKLLSKIFQSYGEKAEAIADGRYDERWPTSTITELERMGQSLKHMARMIDQREKELVENEEQLQNLIANVPGVVYQYRSNSDSLLSARMNRIVHKKVVDIFGVDSEMENFHDRFVACLPEYDRDRFNSSIAESVKEEKNWHYEGEFIRPTGETIWFEGNAVPQRVGDDLLYYGVLLDITRRKQAEEELHHLISQLKESEERFKALHNASFGGITIHDKGIILECNKGLSEMTGYSVDELIGMNGLLLIAEQAREMVMEKIVAGYEKPYEAIGLRKNGEEFPIRLEARNVPYKGRQVRTVEFRDITDQKKADEELRQLKNYLSNIIDSMPSVLVGVDHDGRVTQWNQKARQATGLTFEQVRDQPLVDVFPRLSGEMENIKNAIHECRVISAQKMAFKTNQETRYVDVTIFPLTANGVEGAVIRVDDVTEHVRMEEMIIQSEKMLTVGGLAAGMAHEINNPLAGILQTSEVMSNRLGNNMNTPANQKAAQEAGVTLEAIQQFMAARGIFRMIDTINSSGRRVADIVSNMLSFARKSNEGAKLHHMDQLLDNTIELAATDYDLKKDYDFKKINIIREYGENLPPVMCESSKIQQVFLNILGNGAQALKQADIDDPRLVVRTYFDKDRDMVCLEIEDNGPGMDENTRKKVFDPFFTTKPTGKGTGLGMSVSYFIITENHGGEMIVKSEPGSGATFIIRLPVKGVAGEAAAS